jgi:5-methylcytosine-specific restriction endonuclease McrA
MMEIVSRSEAKAMGLKQYFTGKPCKHGHIATRFTSKGTCSVCLHATTQTWRASNPDVFEASSKETRARRVEEIRAYKLRYNVEKAEAVKAYRKDYRTRNADVIKERLRRWRERNEEHCAAYQRRWSAKNPDRVRAHQLISQATRRSRIAASSEPVGKIAGWVRSVPKICHWCGVKCAKNYHVDHYHPVSKGGRHEVKNLVIACPPCNLRKSAKDPYEFAASRGRLF